MLVVARARAWDQRYTAANMMQSSRDQTARILLPVALVALFYQAGEVDGQSCSSKGACCYTAYRTTMGYIQEAYTTRYGVCCGGSGWSYSCGKCSRTNYRSVAQYYTEEHQVFSCCSGYYNSDSHCIEIDECSSNNGGCQHNCHNTAGSYYCTCNIGWSESNNGKTCTDIDECAVSNGGCAQVCNNTPGSYNCLCHDGGQSCQAANKCQTGIGSCQHNCVNIEGSLSCTCDSGYALASDSFSCQDIDECADSDNGGCQLICKNSIGSYSCDCEQGYKLLADGSTCEALPCPTVIPPSNGTMNCTGMVTGHNCTFKCDPGHSLVGSSLRQCLPTSTWSGAGASCNPMLCEPLGGPTNGFVQLPCHRDFTSTCSIQCEFGYQLDGPSQRTCVLTESQGGVEWTEEPSCSDCSHGSACTGKQRINLFIAVGSALGALLVALMICVSLVFCSCYVKKRNKTHFTNDGIKLKQMSLSPVLPPPRAKHAMKPRNRSSDTRYMEYSLLKRLDSSSILPSSTIDLVSCVGKGEFGVVYKARLNTRDCGFTRIVAVKTLRGEFSKKELGQIMKESIKMRNFHHANVMALIGVCINAGTAPYIVLPFMSNGSLHGYLKRERPNIYLSGNMDQEMIIEVEKRLLDMCLQIAKGMEYLAVQKFVHRDLATRNCLIDDNFVIKVADFGLSESMYNKVYFKEKECFGVKLPIKWMALESLNDYIYTEKTDVWSYGVTCWEVFSAGRAPYPVMDTITLLSQLECGHRLQQPNNLACSDKIYSAMKRCWLEDPKTRPTFSQLVVMVEGIMAPLADYMDFSAYSRLLEPQELRDNTDSTL